MNLFNLIIGTLIIVIFNFLFAFLIKKIMKKNSPKFKAFLTCCISSLFLMICITLAGKINSIFLETLFSLCVFEVALYTPIEKYMNYQKNKTKDKKSQKQPILTISVIFNVIFIVTLTIIGIKFYKLDKRFEETSSDLIKTIHERIEIENSFREFTDGRGIAYTKEKMKFFNDNIVFVIEGKGNYYQDYDCMIERTEDDSKYLYWAFNKEAAIERGYKKYSCK